MEIPSWVSPNTRWMFWDITQPPPKIKSSGYLWTEKEDAVLIRHYPCHWKLRLLLPSRSVASCQARAQRLRILKPPPVLWDQNEKRWLRDNYEKSSWHDLKNGLPRRSLHAIKAKALAMHLRRGRIKPDNFSVELLRIVVTKAKELNFSLEDLDEEAGLKGYFSSYEPSAWVRVDAVNKAIQAMGGELTVRWWGE